MKAGRQGETNSGKKSQLSKQISKREIKTDEDTELTHAALGTISDQPYRFIGFKFKPDYTLTLRKFRTVLVKHK
jgi:hypothetical protein